MFAKILMVCALGVLLADDPPQKPQPPATGGKPDDAKLDDAKKQELEKFQGTWKVIGAERNGAKVSEDEYKDLSLVIEGSKRTVKQGDQVRMQSNFKIDPTKSPKQIDITPTAEQFGGRTLPGIYEFDGDTVKVSIGLDGERPKDFKGKERVFVQVFRREKKK